MIISWKTREFLKKWVLPTWLVVATRYPRLLLNLRAEIIPMCSFVINGRGMRCSRRERMRLVWDMLLMNFIVPRAKVGHTSDDILRFMRRVLTLDPAVDGVLVEAGCWKGCGTAKLSWVAGLVDRTLYVFDSFKGIPPNEEHPDGRSQDFPEGAYEGSLEEVKEMVARFGDISRCCFMEGWFEETMATFTEPVAAAYLDCDLESSTRTCLQYLVPRLADGGIIYSQDGHIERVQKLLENERFWEEELGVAKPHIHDLRVRKTVWFTKPAPLGIVEPACKG